MLLPSIVLADPKAPGARDLVTRWLAGFLEVGSLVKRLDTGEGSYAIELEEDYGVYDALGQVGVCDGVRPLRLLGPWHQAGGMFYVNIVAVNQAAAQ